MTLTQPKAKTRSKPSSPATSEEWIARARALAPLIESHSARIEKERKVTPEVHAALIEAGLFHMLVPRSIGGGEADPWSFNQVLEEIAAADASTAWCLGQGIGCTMAAGFLDQKVAAEIFGNGGVLAWGPPSGAKAIAVDGGYRASGRWRFASGSPNATWFGGHSIVCEADGTPRKGPDGKPVMRTMLVPAAKTTIHKVWDVIGLRGTGSDDYEFKDVFVPEAYTTWRDSGPDRRENGPVWNVPLLTMYGMGFSGIALGLARATLKAFMDLAQGKVSSGMSAPLADNAVIQAEVAKATGKLESSRAFLKQMINEFWGHAQKGKDIPLDTRAKLRVAITFGMNQCKEVVDFAYQASGTNAIFEKNPFERRFRDIHTVTQQGQAHESNYQFSGQALFGKVPGHRL